MRSSLTALAVLLLLILALILLVTLPLAAFADTAELAAQTESYCRYIYSDGRAYWICT